MGLVSTLMTHRDATLAVVLTAAYGVEVAWRGAAVGSEPVIAPLELPQQASVALGAAFTLSLAVRRRAPLLVLGLCLVVMAVSGRVPLAGSVTLLAATVVTTWSVGAFSSGPQAVAGALGVGLLTGLLLLREPPGALQARDAAIATLLVAGPWLAGIVSRGTWRRTREPAELQEASQAWAMDDVTQTARDLYETGAHALGNVASQARGARGRPFDDPDLADRVLAGIELAASQALMALRRLAADAAALGGPGSTEPRPGLADLGDLVDQMSEAGLPVDLRIEGSPVALSPALDQLAWEVVWDALGNTLEHAGPARASVVVRYGADELQLDIEDDGPGIGRERDAQDEHDALHDIGERVAFHGGLLEAGPGERGGYWVSVRLPLTG